MLDAAFLSVHQTLVWSFPQFFVKTEDVPYKLYYVFNIEKCIDLEGTFPNIKTLYRIDCFILVCIAGLY